MESGACAWDKLFKLTSTIAIEEAMGSFVVLTIQTDYRKSQGVRVGQTIELFL